MINLNDREKKLLILLIIIVIISFTYYFILTPIMAYKKNSDLSYDNNRVKITALDNTYAEYSNIIEEKKKLNASASKINIVSMTGDIAAELNIKNNINYKSTNTVQNDIEKTTTEIRIEGVPINAFLQFIDKIEGSNLPLKVQKVVLTSGFKDRDSYDSLIVIVSLNKR